jgi:hypothetical protein
MHIKYFYIIFFLILAANIRAQTSGDSLQINIDTLQADTAGMDQIFKTSRDTIKRYEKWGEVSKADREMVRYGPDSTAAAVILHDVGFTQLRPAKKGWYVRHVHVRRIKVLDISAFDQGNLLIPLRSGLNEKVVNLEIHLILPDSTIQPVKSDNVFTQQISKRYAAMKIFIPNLTKGCIIEYRYTLLSGNLFTLHDWYFHQELPVRWSEISLQLSSLFEYAFLAEAPRDFDVTERRNEGFSLSFIRFGLANMPAMKEEPFITTLDDYRAHLRFQLTAIHGFLMEPMQVMSTWPQLARSLAEDKNFGKQYSGKSSGIKALWDDFEPQLIKGESPEVVAEKALRFIADNFRWNGTYTWAVEKNLKDFYNKKSGNTADLNLAVVGLLQKAGLDAVPVLLSTRSNGAVYQEYPFIQQFNSVVALLRVGDKKILIDATDPLNALNQLQAEHYNEAGWIADAQKPAWMPLKPIEMGATWFGNLVLNEAGEIDGNFVISASGLLATEWRRLLKSSKRAEFLKENFATEYQDATFDSLVISDENNLNKPLKLTFKCHIANTANVVNDFIYFKPVLDFIPSENPLKSLQRNLPINLGHPVKAQYVVNVTLPPGYKIEEKPEPARVNLCENAGRLQFSCDGEQNGHFQLNLKATITETLFLKEQYHAVRSFFNLMMEKSAVQLVLKKQ